jgi:serine phosphatase RsbU (regulator of sigma subunit)
MTASGTTPYLHYWVAVRPLIGQSQSGDQYVVACFDGGVLIAVVDGLGHGDDAAHAAKTAVATLAAHAHDPVTVLLQRCHEDLRKTRGAVMSIASYRAADKTLTWAGVGNVEGLLVRAAAQSRDKPHFLLSRGGIVGDRLPSLSPTTLHVHDGDLLLFATDGIGSSFSRDLRPTEQAPALITHIFTQYAKTTDDALILGARWKGGSMVSESKEN